MTWFVTTDLHTALAGNYIGEVELHRTELWQALFGQCSAIMLYYYGERDQELSELFGYT
jgi:hypothetical protein